MKHLWITLLVLLTAGAGRPDHPPAAARRTVLLPGLGDLHHPVSTRSRLAQQFFDQGLTLVYAFNHEEAILSFRRAAELDPQLAMAHWGIALALGENINTEITPERQREAHAAIRQALALADAASEPERAYMQALARRYTDAPNPDLKQLALTYSTAMGELVRRYPDDLDAAALYAESALDLRPWRQWEHDGRPAEGTLAIVALLEAGLRRDPLHIGVNHYYIHAVEASPHPEWALPSAGRLARLAPGAGHLVHMPSHIYYLVGDYDAASRANRAAVAADRALFERTGDQTEYAMHYYSHNLHFLAAARAMEGRQRDALRAADELVAHVRPRVKEMPFLLAPFMPTPAFILVRFRRWDEILRAPAPDAEVPIAAAGWHFARGMALAATGKPDDATAERDRMLTAANAIPRAMLMRLNPAASVLKVPEALLAARIAQARGDRPAALAQLRQAVAAGDALSYDEPPDWYLPPRESLGGLLLLDGQNEAAEQVFRADLRRHVRSGRSLFGLWESLKRQRQDYAAGLVEREFTTAWRNADTRLRVEDL